ncbi:D-alanyl-D-alanine carboxypeptidase [Priestia taiwanensis]|uniref:D-alanyl-D-alanine carboxypeptidase n=1 Tax=Priestia taiwanensis TaxID=1347902 RepID=A0A917EM60_9BACI|nr:D-alanyl-D-alanine carboxypeptidase family protein [Priestia taiwanensis]MBM7361557.1 D-alanyl-D-alanine carboxypeptidase [Priestia taiwanensis]GGE55161.1 D-alanyl-D-alanine carboxypeptidase [Priestia taiwanensis]
MRIRKIVLLIMIAVLCVSSYGASYTYAEINTDVSAYSAVLMEQDSGRVLYGKKLHEKRRIASITKIMTAVLAVESGKLDEMVTISDTAVRTEGSSIYLAPGQKIKLRDLVYGLMLRSGNDAAQAIAETVGGSIEGFVYMMNEKAAEIGMLNTQFINPHGLDGKGFEHYSTAYDMAILARYAMQHEDYREIAGTKFHKAPNTEQSWDYAWKNKNKLLTGLYEFSTGGKTGFTKQAGRTLVSTASKEKENLICVTITAGDDWNDHISLFNKGFDQYDLVKLIKKGPVGEVPKELKGHVYTKDAYKYPLTTEEQGEVDIRYEIEEGKEFKNGDKVGLASIYIGEKKVGEKALFYSSSKLKLQASYWLDGIKEVFSMMVGEEVDG